MRERILCVLLALMATTAAADESPVGISEVDTKDLRLYYYDSLSYLVPHVVRTFTNSLAFQRKMFGWTPDEPIVLLMQDFADYGGANAYAAPHSMLVFDVSPVSHAFETYPASEHMYSADEPRDGSRDVERHLVRGRSALAAILSRQGRRPAAEPRNLALQLPDGPALHRPTLVP